MITKVTKLELSLNTELLLPKQLAFARHSVHFHMLCRPLTLIWQCKLDRHYAFHFTFIIMENYEYLSTGRFTM